MKQNSQKKPLKLHKFRKKFYKSRTASIYIVNNPLVISLFLIITWLAICSCHFSGSSTPAWFINSPMFFSKSSIRVLMSSSDLGQGTIAIIYFAPSPPPKKKIVLGTFHLSELCRQVVLHVRWAFLARFPTNPPQQCIINNYSTSARWIWDGR